jgi:hypothetical protein
LLNVLLHNYIICNYYIEIGLIELQNYHFFRLISIGQWFLICEIYSQGVVGSITSSKSALIHRYLTGECPKEERLNGCHKKEVLVDGQSYLLLVRNETGSPDVQVK